MTPMELIHKLNLNDIPEAVKEQAKLSILDLIGIGAGGAGTRLSAIIREQAAQEFALVDVKCVRRKSNASHDQAHLKSHRLSQEAQVTRCDLQQLKNQVNVGSIHDGTISESNQP